MSMPEQFYTTERFIRYSAKLVELKEQLRLREGEYGFYNQMQEGEKKTARLLCIGRGIDGLRRSIVATQAVVTLLENWNKEN